MGQRAVIYMPADKTITHSPKRLGKVVIIGWREEEKHAEFNYAEQIASKTDYPAMVVLNPGTFKGQPGETEWFHFFGKRHRKSKDAMDHRFFRMAVPYMRAMDIFSEILQEKNIRAILGGHSKRATSAYTAAAMDPKRVAGVVLLSNEAPFYLPKYREGYLKPVSIIENQKYIQCPVIYIGATNEDGYEMFNINRIQASLKKPWTLEIIPNHQHSTDSEVQFTNWMMWVSHVFDGRPLTQIRDLSYEETPTGTVFRAHIDSPNKLIDIRFWYVYNDDPAFWRDLVWYRAFYSVHKKSDTLYEAHVMGKLPDAWMVEVKDSALGVPGYVSSMPQDITHQETKWRPSRGQRSRLWEEKK
jgi:pimeloyl-ACP methyl ester carboxylesterase